MQFLVDDFYRKMASEAIIITLARMHDHTGTYISLPDFKSSNRTRK